MNMTAEELLNDYARTVSTAMADRDQDRLDKASLIKTELLSRLKRGERAEKAIKAVKDWFEKHDEDIEIHNGYVMLFEKKGFVECLCNFMADSTGLTTKDMKDEIQQYKEAGK